MCVTYYTYSLPHQLLRLYTGSALATGRGLFDGRFS